MTNDSEQVTFFGETDFRNRRTKFGIKAKDRTKHMYVIGKTGMGKSTFLENMAVQDIRNGSGMAFIDPHGASAELLLDYIPKERIKDVVYFAPFDSDYPVSFNVMEDVGKDQRHLVASGLMAAFKKIWVDAWSARMEYILSNTILALLEYPGATLLGVNRMLSDKKFREEVVSNVTDPGVKAFWVDEFANYTERFAAEATPAIQNKVGQFTSNPIIRNIIGQPKSSFDIRKMMDEKKILIVNLSKGRMGEINSNLIGGMLITKIYLAAMSRAELSMSEIGRLPNFYFYVDEFQSFVNDTFADILAEARKYKLNLTIAHQYIEQMPEAVRDAVFGNVGTTITFRVGPFDAEVLEKVFAPKFEAQDLVNLGAYQMYLTLMIDGVGSPPFSATTLPPIRPPETSYREDVIAYTRLSYARSRAEVENEISAWHQGVRTGEGSVGSTSSPRPNQNSSQGSRQSSAPSQGARPHASRPPEKNFAPGGLAGSSAGEGEAVRRKRKRNKPGVKLGDLIRGALGVGGATGSAPTPHVSNSTIEESQEVAGRSDDDLVYKSQPQPDETASVEAEEDLPDIEEETEEVEVKPNAPTEIPEAELRKLLEVKE